MYTYLIVCYCKYTYKERTYQYHGNSICKMDREITYDNISHVYHKLQENVKEEKKIEIDLADISVVILNIIPLKTEVEIE